MKLIQTVALIVAGVLTPSFCAGAENDLKARIVLFISEDADPPEDWERRIRSLAIRTENFFGHWLKHWSKDIEKQTVFARTEDGDVEVTLVQGQLQSTGRSALPEIRKLAIEKSSQQLGLKRDQSAVWWILYDCPGVRGFQGGIRGTGGVAINAYPRGTELIKSDSQLATPEMAEMAIKGTIHELGHALGLPHIGPRPARKLGNTLMGPINRAYWSRTSSREPRVYLSEASAGMLWKHPIFRSESVSDPKMPQLLKVTRLTATEIEDGAKLMIKGTLLSDSRAHAAVVLDSETGRFGDYWERSYLGKVDAAMGEFKVEIVEPRARGTLFLGFCFDNGINTGDGTTPFQRGSSIQIRYSGNAGLRKFELPE